MKRVRAGAAALALGLALGAPVAELSDVPAVQAAESGTAVQQGLVKSGKKYYYYKNGKKVKKAWVTVKVKKKKYKYYFGKTGAACTGVKKIKGKIYCFNAKGQMQKDSWYKKKYYCGKNGAAYTGIRSVKVIKKIYGMETYETKLFAFDKNGKMDSAKSALLQSYTRPETEITPLKKIVGEPKRVQWYSGGCYVYQGQSGTEGDYIYDGFTLSVFKVDGSGMVIVLGLK